MYKIAVQMRYSASYICGMIKSGSYDVVLLLGGNQGDRVRILAQAVNMICDALGVIKSTSRLFESSAWGFKSDHEFLNQAVLITTELGPRSVLIEILKIETELGRTRTGGGYTDRVIDIDILAWEEKIFWTSTLQVPHIRLHERAFALAPLNDVLPDWKHPLLELTTTEMLNQLPDADEVQPLITTVDG